MPSWRTLPLSIILAGEYDIYGWFYSEFTQLYSFDNDNGKWLKFYNYGVTEVFEPLEYFILLQYPIRLGEDLIELLILLIKNGYYVQMNIDDSHITTMILKS